MANTTLFSSLRGAFVPNASARNEAGGLAYVRTPESALALYAATGCLNGTFYASAAEQLDKALALAAQCDPAFVARTAVYARQVAHMKDMPALLLATLSTRDRELLAKAFPLVVDNGRMLRNFVQIVRSGVVGRKSLGSLPKRLVRQWLERASVDAIVQAAIGNQPSLADVIRMVHPKPVDPARQALYAWVVGKPFDIEALPAKLQAYEAFKRVPVGQLPDLPFQYYTSLRLSAKQWRVLARNASWQTLRQNLNTFARNDVFTDGETVKALAATLRDPAKIAKARVFPYQLMMAYTASGGGDVPTAIREALQDAMEVATRQVPKLDGRVVVAVDVSGSMGSPVTGHRKGATTSVRCVDVAALVAACVQRSNPDARVLPFDTDVRPLQLNPRDSVMTQAKQLASLCGGGTSISSPLARLNREGAIVDLLVIVSDNESWADTRAGGATETMRQWAQIKARCPQAKLVCIDLQPVATSQVVERDDVIHVGGFSDAVFDLLAVFAAQGANSPRWVDKISSIEL
ncbi:vWA domain-containing protein [Thermomonas carbonis]|uniref:VWA domain-containing protein n=1 Tax=Thermomonas carbonis TaxID=1463158 RepID=A0A7G9SLR1_9GAMM|nr:VWA domain-containing protein [Thermomonas carbonis]QNN68786.1 VWA domain-containing protein [Thermomonas carbonis]GHC08790.1 ribonucleoprotein [Thermomonas carbonis]